MVEKSSRDIVWDRNSQFWRSLPLYEFHKKSFFRNSKKQEGCFQRNFEKKLKRQSSKIIMAIYWSIGFVISESTGWERNYCSRIWCLCLTFRTWSLTFHHEPDALYEPITCHFCLKRGITDDWENNILKKSATLKCQQPKPLNVH